MEIMKILTIYEYIDYKKFVLAWLKNQPNRGRGFFTSLASKLGTSNAAISQIFKDSRHLNLEQAIELCELLLLTDDESTYLILLVEYARAGSVKLQKKLLSQIKKEQSLQQKLFNKLPKDAILSNDVKSIYYSSWLYTGLRNLIATDKIQNIDALALRLRTNRHKIQKTIQFLTDNNLLLNINGKLQMGPMKTHLENTSPWIKKHHQNWRLKALESIENESDNDLFYSAPMSLSHEVAVKIRQQIPEFIKQIIEEVGPSKSEVVRCLNIDWFEY